MKNLFLLIKNHITDFPVNTFIKFCINVKVILVETIIVLI